MGAIFAHDTRKISFDNKCALPPVIPLDKPINGRQLMEKSNKVHEYLNDVQGTISNEDSQYWAERMAALENEHQLINKIMQMEYEKTLKSTNKLFGAPKPTQEKLKKIIPCIAWRTKVLKCYEENPRQPLNCSKVVQAFTNCVSSCHGDN